MCHFIFSDMNKHSETTVFDDTTTNINMSSNTVATQVKIQQLSCNTNTHIPTTQQNQDHVQPTLTTLKQTKRRIQCNKCTIVGYVRAWCRLCKGNKICSHDRQKARCRECSKSAFCVHGRYKYYCKNCKGHGICSHGRRKYRCKVCKSNRSSIQRRQLKPALSTKRSFVNIKQQHTASNTHHRLQCNKCEIVGRVRPWCRTCKGKQVCGHGRGKSKCTICKGVGVCVHGRRKYQCKKCHGKGICEHNRQKSKCKECIAAQALINLIHLN